MSLDASHNDHDLVAASHRRQLALCAELEGIADSLPDRVDTQRCLHLARALCPIVMEAQALEERVLFSRFGDLEPFLPDLAASIERLRWEHFEDLCFGEEIRDALYDLGRGEAGIGGDTLGYMLRGFFEGLRRHVAFEREVLVPYLETGANPNHSGSEARPD